MMGNEWRKEVESEGVYVDNNVRRPMGGVFWWENERLKASEAQATLGVRRRSESESKGKKEKKKW